MNVIITGAGRGVGLALVHEFLNDSRTARVYACSRNLSAFNNHPDINNRLRCIPIDLKTPESFEQLLTSLKEDGVKHISVLINNAGYLINKPMEEQSCEEVTASYFVNVIGPHLLIAVLKPYMIGGGHVVNIGSMGGMLVTSKFPGLSSYSASKAAIAVLSELLAEEFLSDEIFVNCLALGTVNTEMLQAAFPGHEGQQTPESIGKLIKSFACHGHNWFNGKVLPVALTGK